MAFHRDRGICGRIDERPVAQEAADPL